MVAALKERFALNAAKATKLFNKAFFSFKNIARNKSAVSQFVFRMLEHTRAMGIFEKDNFNWYGNMV